MAGADLSGLYAAWFNLADSDRDGQLTGGEAVAFLTRSDLPKQTLKRVSRAALWAEWELSTSSARRGNQGECAAARGACTRARPQCTRLLREPGSPRAPRGLR
jgi:hypothetical protein